MGWALLKRDWIATTDHTASRYDSIYADVRVVMLSCRPKDSRILREIPLRKSGHHATPARAGDVQTHGRPDRERVADPIILLEALLT